MLRLGRETALHVAKAQDDSVADLIGEWTAEGIDTYTFSEEELAAVSEQLKAVSTDWVERISNDRAQEVLESYRDLTSQ